MDSFLMDTYMLLKKSYKYNTHCTRLTQILIVYVIKPKSESNIDLRQQLEQLVAGN